MISLLFWAGLSESYRLERTALFVVHIYLISDVHVFSNLHPVRDVDLSRTNARKHDDLKAAGWWLYLKVWLTCFGIRWQEVNYTTFATQFQSLENKKYQTFEVEKGRPTPFDCLVSFNWIIVPQRNRSRHCNIIVHIQRHMLTNELCILPHHSIKKFTDRPDTWSSWAKLWCYFRKIYIYTQPENKIDVKTHMLYKLYLVPSKIVSIYRFAMEFYQTQEEHIKEQLSKSFSCFSGEASSSQLLCIQIRFFFSGLAIHIHTGTQVRSIFLRGISLYTNCQVYFSCNYAVHNLSWLRFFFSVWDFYS